MKKLLTISIVIISLIVIFTTSVYAVTPVQFWAGSIPTTVTEALTVKVGTTVLPDGYAFTAVNMKTGETHVKTITVTNTASAGTWLVKPVVSSPYPDYVSVSITPTGGYSLVPGNSGDFTLTLTALKATPSVTVAVSFTKE